MVIFFHKPGVIMPLRKASARAPLTPLKGRHGAWGIGHSYLAFYNNVSAYYSCIRGNEHQTRNKEQRTKF